MSGVKTKNVLHKKIKTTHLRVIKKTRKKTIKILSEKHKKRRYG